MHTGMRRIAIHGGREIPDLAGVTRVPFIWPTIHDQPAAQATAKEQIEERRELLTRPIPMLTNRGSRGVVLQEDGKTQALTGPTRQGDVVPAREGGRVDDVL